MRESVKCLGVSTATGMVWMREVNTGKVVLFAGGGGISTMINKSRNVSSRAPTLWTFSRGDLDEHPKQIALASLITV